MTIVQSVKLTCNIFQDNIRKCDHGIGSLDNSLEAIAMPILRMTIYEFFMRVIDMLGKNQLYEHESEEEN